MTSRQTFPKITLFSNLPLIKKVGKMATNIDSRDEPELNIMPLIQAFVKEHQNGLQKQELYFYPDELDFPVIGGKVIRVTIDYVSLAKLENRAES